MGKVARPILADDTDQAAQAALLVRTGNGVAAEDEAERLEALFGPADENGVYGALNCQTCACQERCN
jgi:hypothetical protein